MDTCYPCPREDWRRRQRPSARTWWAPGGWRLPPCRLSLIRSVVWNKWIKYDIMIVSRRESWVTVTLVVLTVDTSEEYELSSQQCPCILYYTGWCLSIVALLRTGPSLQSTDTDWRLFLTRARRRARLLCRLHQRRKRAKWANVVHLCMNTVSNFANY